jgi:hypothetical protein
VGASKRDHDPAMRRAQRVLLMVHELHKLGYQRLRIVPGMSPSGMHWRCSVTHTGNILAAHGAMMRIEGEAAHYTSGQGNAFFDWEDARRDTARQLAGKFLERFAELAAKGRGLDWSYAGWYVQMLGFAERGALPVAYADWDEEPDRDCLPTIGNPDEALPMPPRVGAQSGDDSGHGEG